MLVLKVLLTWPYLLLSINKARRQAKQVQKDPNVILEENRYHGVQKRFKYALWLVNVKIIVHDIENGPDRGCVLAGNHQSNYDPLVMFVINDFNQFAPGAFIAKKEILNKKVVRSGARLIDVLFLDRDNMRDAVRVMREANSLVRIPRSLFLFPEGTRSKGIEVNEYKGAFFNIAKQTHVPIVPFTIINSCYVKPFSGKRNYVHVFFHPVFKPQTNLHRSTDAIAQNLKTINQKTLKQYSGLSSKDSAKMYKIWRKIRKERRKENKKK